MFPNLLFSSNTWYLEKLSDILVSFCSFAHSGIRSQAAALLYLILKKNFEITKGDNFAKVTAQLTATLSELVVDIKDSRYVDISLDSITKYANAEKMPERFITQVENLTGRLQTILKDLNLINEYPDDPVMQADLYVRICDSYKSNIELRVTSLQGLAKLQEENGNLTEAAHAHIHIAALIAEYLADVENFDESLPNGSVAFAKLSQSCLQESIADSDKESLQRTEIFCEEGLVNSMAMAASLLVSAEEYDNLNELYKLLIPIYEKRNDYALLARCHGQLQEAYTNILTVSQGAKRFFNAYYRVAFHGAAFREMDGKEYIYKERALTRLSEITLRLKGYYTSKFGDKITLHIYTKSGGIVRDTLEDLESNCYIQITSVEPYLESWELRERKTEFSKSHNIERFIYSTPFTKTGKSQTENITEQYQRKTILTASAPFPYLTTRLEVIEHTSTELSPLDNALALIEGRILTMTTILNSPDVNCKVLQPVLTGSVSAVVHAGPMAICKGFFENPSHEESYDQKDLDQLKRALLEFLEVCKEGLEKNRIMMDKNELAFHTSMEVAYEEMKQTMHAVLL